jgi:hypothetical protein
MGDPSLEWMVHVYSSFSDNLLASRNGSITEVTGNSVNSGTRTRAIGIGKSLDLSPNIGFRLSSSCGDNEGEFRKTPSLVPKHY